MISGRTLEGFFDEFEKIALTFQELAAKVHMPAVNSLVKGNVTHVPFAQSAARAALNPARRRLSTAATQLVAPIVQKVAA